MHQSIDKKKKIIIYIVLLLVLSTTRGKFLEKQKNYSLKIDNIKVFGLTIDKNLEIKNDLNSVFYQNIFFLGKEEIKKILNKHNIKKIYPSTLNIDIKATKFLAKITNVNNLKVGSNGKLISDEQSDEILPNIFGEFNSEKFLRFKSNIEQSKFNFDEFKTIYFFSSNRCDILTIDNILIKLPQNNVSESLNKAHKIIASNKFKDKSF